MQSLHFRANLHQSSISIDGVNMPQLMKRSKESGNINSLNRRQGSGGKNEGNQELFTNHCFAIDGGPVYFGFTH